ncbi:MAG: ABC transporter permease subunit, partial [Bacteroidota bacterium]
MTGTIARKEAAETLRDGRFRWAAAAVLVLLAGALVSGWIHTDRLADQHAEAARADRDVWTGQEEKNPHSAAHFGNYAFKPVTPLLAVDRGVTAYTGVALFMEGHAIQDARYRPAEDASASARLGELTAAAVLQWLVPLLVVLLTFGAFAGERERGTLRTLLSQGVSRRALAGGKALGAAAPLALILIPAAILGAVAMALFAPPEAAAWSAPRVGLLALVYLAYFAVFVGVSLLVSALARSPRSALLILLGFWFANGFIAPRLAADVAERVHPGLTTEAFAEGEAAVGELSWPDLLDRVTEELLAEEGVSTVDSLSVNIMAVRLYEGEKIETAGYRDLFDRLADGFERQGRVAQVGAVVAPLLAVAPLSTALTGTDYRHHRHFADAAEVYRYTYVQALNQDLIDNAAPGGTWDREYVVGEDFWGTIPAFEYEAPGARWALGGHGLALGFLSLWLVGLALAVPAAVAR